MPITGTDIAKDLGDTFNRVVSAPVNVVKGAVDKAKGFLGSTPIIPDKSNTSWHTDMVKQANDSFKKEPTTKPKPVTNKPLPSYKKGTDYVPKTGTAKLHQGEAVLKKEDSEKYRNAKDKNMSKESVMKEAASSLAGKPEEKPKKEISHIVTHKAKGGAYVH